MSRVEKSWTRPEEVELCLMRWMKYGHKRIAVILGRSLYSVRMKAWTLRMTRPAVRVADLDRIVREGRAAGKTDKKLATEHGLHRCTVFECRKRLGIPPVPTPQQAWRTRGK
jgi:hypothetical protein